MSEKNLTQVLILGTLILLGGIFYINRQSNNLAPEVVESTALSEAVASSLNHDWGDIGINDGKVAKTFQIQNNGSEDLALTNVATSCMCTTAQLSIGDESSPIYGMHTNSTYMLKIPSGETADLRVVFDPAYHGPTGTGSITRQVKVATNDPDNSELIFTLTADVKGEK